MIDLFQRMGANLLRTQERLTRTQAQDGADRTGRLPTAFARLLDDPMQRVENILETLLPTAPPATDQPNDFPSTNDRDTGVAAAPAPFDPGTQTRRTGNNPAQQPPTQAKNPPSGSVQFGMRSFPAPPLAFGPKPAPAIPSIRERTPRSRRTSPDDIATVATPFPGEPTARFPVSPLSAPSPRAPTPAPTPALLRLPAKPAAALVTSPPEEFGHEHTATTASHSPAPNSSADTSRAEPRTPSSSSSMDRPAAPLRPIRAPGWESSHPPHPPARPPSPARGADFSGTRFAVGAPALGALLQENLHQRTAPAPVEWPKRPSRDDFPRSAASNGAAAAAFGAVLPAEPSSVASSFANSPEQPGTDVDALLDELEQRLQLELLRAYGTSGF